MSTRRTTRATSRAASSRGASPAITEADIPATPSARRSSRRGGSATPLPAIASRASTAYGTNTTTQPASLKLPEQGEEIDNALHSILHPRSNYLQPVREEDTPSDAGTTHGNIRDFTRGRASRRAASSTPVPDRSYTHEENIFGVAGVESSVISSSDLPNSPELPVHRPLTQKQKREQQEREEILRDMARTQVVDDVRNQEHDQASAVNYISHFISKSCDKALDVISLLIHCLSRVWSFAKTWFGVAAIVFGITAIILLASSGSYRWYGPFDLSHNIGQFIPEVVAHPIKNFTPNEIRDLETRMKKAEYDIAYLKKRTDIDGKAISRLEKILPDQLVVKKDKSGNLEITHEFWHALDAKMRAENTYFQDKAAGKPSKKSSKNDLSTAEVETIIERSKIWDKFLLNNRAQLKAWTAKEFDAKFPEKLKDSIKDGSVVTKQEFLALVRQNWDDTQKEIKTEIRKISQQFDDNIRNAGQDVVRYSKEEIKAIATDAVHALLATAQLEGLSKAKKNVNVAAGLHRVNHFSQGTGAVVNPKLTSPNYLFPSMDRNFIIKFSSWALWKPIPSPNPPEVALQRWEEHGDCWCSPAKDADGFGPSLAVIMGNQIYPDQIIIEHIPRTGSLEPGAAPMDMELLAYIADTETYLAVKKRSEEIFDDDSIQYEPQPFGFVQIGSWTYDAHSLSNIQSFPPQIDLSTFKGSSHTNRLIIRSKNNWGGGTVDFTCLYRVRVNGPIADSPRGHGK